MYLSQLVCSFCFCQVMSKRLPQQQLTTLVFMLFEGLIDSQTNCCRSSSVILNTMLKSRGAGLQELVPITLRCLKPETHRMRWRSISAFKKTTVYGFLCVRYQRCWRFFTCVFRTSQTSRSESVYCIHDVSLNLYLTFLWWVLFL